MDLLSREENAYIRGSPTRGVLGGIAEHTSDVITLCEAGGLGVLHIFQFPLKDLIIPLYLFVLCVYILVCHSSI